jgi:hypothetical protein
MNFEEIKHAVNVQDDRLLYTTVTLDPGSFVGSEKLFRYCYGNNPIVISNASLASINEGSRTITINGKASFKNVPDLQVQLAIAVNERSEAQITLYYELIGAGHGPNRWTFSQSFPNLPKVVDGNKPTLFDRSTGKITQTMVVPLDTLYLTDTYFVVTNIPHHDDRLNIELKWGINFYGHLRPEGLLGVVTYLFKSASQLVVSGTIREPYNNETTAFLSANYSAPSTDGQKYPWDIEDDFTDSLPGIFLKVHLGLNYAVINNKLNFKGEYVYFYTPLTENYVLSDTTPQFVPVQAYAGSIEVETSQPQDKLIIEMVSPVDPGVDLLQLHARFKNFDLKNIARLTGLTGSDRSPFEFLPEEIKKAGSGLGKLELLAASIIIDYTDLNYIDLSYVSFTIGMKDLNWQVWQNHFVIKNIGCTFNIDYPLSTENDIDEMFARELEVVVFGRMAIEEVDFDIIAKNTEDFTVYAQMSKAQTIPLSKIIKKYADGIEPPGDLTINTFRLGIAPFKSYSFAMAMAREPHPWKLNLGPHELVVSDVSMGINYTGGKASGSVSGTVSLTDEVTLFLNYSTPGDVVMRSFIADIELNKLFGKLVNQSFDLPSLFDIRLKQNSVLIQKTGSNYVFKLATVVENFGLLALQVQKIGGKWGVALGMDIASGRLSKIDGLGFLHFFEDLFPLDKLTLVISSFNAPAFDFPDVAKFNNPVINGKNNIKLPQQASLVSGMNFYGKWSLDPSKPEQRLLQGLLNIRGSLDVVLQVSKVPSDSSKLIVSLSNTTILGLDFNCTFGGQIVGGEVGVFLQGDLTTHVGSNTQKFNVALLFVPNGGFMSATMEGIIDLEIFQLCDVALEVGISLEGLPSLGLAGTIVAGKMKSSVAVFFDSANPSHSLVAGSISDLSLADIFNTFTGLNESSINSVLEEVEVKGTDYFEIPVGTIANDLDNRKLDKLAQACAHKLIIPTTTDKSLFVVGEKGKVWFLTDKTNKMRHYAFKKLGDKIIVSTEAQFYFAPQTTNIGSLEYKKNFYVNATIVLFGFEARIQVDIDPDRGIYVRGKMSKLVIGHENLFSIMNVEKTDGPVVSVSTYQDDNREAMFRQPHFFVNGKLTMLGSSYQADVKMTTSGGEFDIQVSLLLGTIKGSLKGKIKDFNDMSIGGTLKVGIDDIDLKEFGTFPIKTGASASMNIYVTPQSMGISFGVVFELAGITLDAGTLKLNATTDNLSQLPGVILAAIKKVLEDKFIDPKEWAKFAKNAINWTHDQIQNGLKELFKLDDGDAEIVMAIVFPICAVTNALVNM